MKYIKLSVRNLLFILSFKRSIVFGKCSLYFWGVKTKNGISDPYLAEIGLLGMPCAA